MSPRLSRGAKLSARHKQEIAGNSCSRSGSRRMDPSMKGGRPFRLLASRPARHDERSVCDQVTARYCHSRSAQSLRFVKFQCKLRCFGLLESQNDRVLAHAGPCRGRWWRLAKDMANEKRPRLGAVVRALCFPARQLANVVRQLAFDILDIELVFPGPAVNLPLGFLDRASSAPPSS